MSSPVNRPAGVWRAAQLTLLLVGASMVSPAAGAHSEVSSVSTSSTWAAFFCRKQLLSRVCDLDKDYTDAGLSPSIVSVGDVVWYQNRHGSTVGFTVRAINLYVYERDRTGSGAWEKPGGKKGDALCFLFDTASKERITRSYASRIVIKDCREVQG